MNKNLLTVSQYAAKYGITRQSVLGRIIRGKLKAEKLGKYWIITDNE